MKTNPRIIKAYHVRFCWQQLFGLIYNITISLTSIRKSKTETKIITEKKSAYISTRARIFNLYHPVTNTPKPNPLSYRHCQETNFEILLIMANRCWRRNGRSPLHGSPQRKFQRCAARVLIRADFRHLKVSWVKAYQISCLFIFTSMYPLLQD